MKIGFLGGTFDPIHLGHVCLAVQLKEAQMLDQVWICPARFNPFKTENGGAPIERRLAMARLAVKSCPFIQVIDHEARREGPSYTIQTLEYLKKEYPKDQFCLLLGEDSLAGFENWKSAQALAEQFPIYTGSRRCEGMPRFKNKLIEKTIQEGYTPLPQFDISATQVRDRLKKKAFCGHLLNQEVLDYISEFNLY